MKMNAAVRCVMQLTAIHSPAACHYAVYFCSHALNRLFEQFEL